MLNITELDEMVCQQLDLASLARCAQVNKKWNEAVTPFVWRTIPRMSRDRWSALHRLVLEDYHKESYRPDPLRLQEQHPPPAKKVRRSTRINTPLESEQREQAGSPALTKYGHCVRQVEDFAALLTHMAQANSDSSNNTAHYSGPSARKLVLHFLKRCPHALLDFEMTHKHIHEIKTFKLALKAMPKVRTLTIRGIYDSRSRVRVSNLKQVLAAASHHLDTLTLATPEVRAIERSNGGGSTATGVPEPEITARPKKLELDNFGAIGGHTEDWSWLWRTCGQLQQLQVRSISSEITESLIKGIKDSMPYLDSVVFGHSIHTRNWYDICDNRVGAIIAAGTKGWRAVHCGFTAQIGPEAFEALLQHASTLEEFSVVRVQDRTGIIRIFKSCSKLRKLITLDDGDHGSGNFPEVQSADFVDWDPVLKTVRPWPCKTTLETLAIKITDMARWDLLHMPSTTWQGLERHFLETQHRVPERLGEFSNLKALKLGHTARVNNTMDWSILGDDFRGATVPKQDMCVRLIREIGLDGLDGLKQLEELHIPNMEHQVTQVQEVEWMVEHWPNLWKIVGLDPNSNAFKWLKENHPKIRLE